MTLLPQDQEQILSNKSSHSKEVLPRKKNFLLWFLVPAIISGSGFLLFISRYSNKNIEQMALQTPAEDSTFVGSTIGFQVGDNYQTDVTFDIVGPDGETTLNLRNIDLSRLIPQVPEFAKNNPALRRWFLTEREFNRQRVIFAAGSEHIDIPGGLGGYSADQLSIGLTNNCLGASYWELAIYAETPSGQETIYQGYFDFPRGAYADIVSDLNPVSYWSQARNLEAWPKFGFLKGMQLDLGAFRDVVKESEITATDLADAEIMALGEQDKKSNLIVGEIVGTTWADLRSSDLQFHSFVPPGTYDENRLWGSDYSQIETLDKVIGREIDSPLTTEPLKEVEIVFNGSEGTRKLILTGLDMDAIPQLAPENYSDGIYRPLGFGTPFTQDYEDLKRINPTEHPFMAMVLDGDDRVVDYRIDIGLNGVVLHRDQENPNLLHVYPMSYERITLVGHYTVDMGEV
ncbi:hypothetical protein Lepto7375DRAFT_8354 [Leptolyngbya sp. PCC 7375]|nr:hypothetical protein Lepto7375DRAFT_8354 [Leptolyngbya sp. PCC 7375]